MNLNYGISDKLNNKRTFTSKIMIQFLEQVGYLENKKIWGDFQPILSSNFDNLVSKLLHQFTKVIHDIAYSNLHISTTANVSIQSKYGKFMDYIIKLGENNGFKNTYPELSDKIKKANNKNNIEVLLDIINRNHTIFLSFWHIVNDE